MTSDEWGQSDVYLAQRAATCSSARDALAERLRTRVQRLVASFVRGRADAEDGLALALSEIVRAAPTFRGESSLETWADRIAVSTTVRLARMRRLAAVRSDRSLEPEGPVTAPLAHDVFDGLPRSLRAYLDALPETWRTALVLHHVLGYGLPEIAELTEATPEAVRERLLSAQGEVRRRVRADMALEAPLQGKRSEL